MTFMHHRNQDDFLAAPTAPFRAAHPAGHARQVKGSITMGLRHSQAIGQQPCRRDAPTEEAFGDSGLPPHESRNPENHLKLTRMVPGEGGFHEDSPCDPLQVME